MIHIYYLHISIQSNFKFTIEFVGLINSMVNLKMRYIGDIFILFFLVIMLALQTFSQILDYFNQMFEQ
jgi:hypothetical protein